MTFNKDLQDTENKKKASSIVSKEILEDLYTKLGSLKAVGRELKIDSGTVKFYMEKFNIDYKKQVDIIVTIIFSL